MTQDALAERIGELADAVLADPRWQRDDLNVSVLGMLLYGYALAIGRLALFLDMEDIIAAVIRCLIERVGAAGKWTGGLVASANASAFDKAHHPGHHALIGIGHSYYPVQDRAAILDNVFANFASVRSHTVGRILPIASEPGPRTLPKNSVPQLDRTILDRLDTIPWLERCGILEAVPTRFGTCQVAAWPEAAAAYTDAYDSAKRDATSALTRYLAGKYREHYDQWWNVLAKGARDELNARMPERIKTIFHAPGMNPFFTNFPGIVKGDTQMAIVEMSWAAAGYKVPSYRRDLFAIYEAGHLPCGWDGGKFPDGFLVYY
jgi:hypothetical protein